MTAPRARIGLVGIGAMGSAMTARLLDRGWAVGVRDIDPAREAAARALGARVHATPAALAAASDVVIVAVVDAAQTRDVLLGNAGVADGMALGGTVLLCPTIAPADVEQAAAALASRGLHTLDAPMSGGPRRAREGRMSLMLAGDPAVIARHRALLDDLANPVFDLGSRIGDGARTKLVNNLLAAVNLAGAAEALALAGAIGLDPTRTLAVIGASSGQSWIGQDRLSRALAGDGEVLAQVGLLAKDAALALAMVDQAGLETPPQGAAAEAAFARAVRAGLATADDAALYRLALADLARGTPADRLRPGTDSSAGAP